MSGAKTILGERLAKGEITEEEYDRLISKLEPSSELPPTEERITSVASPTPIQPAPTVSGSGAIPWLIIPGGIFLLLMMTKPDSIHSLSEIGIFFFIMLGIAFVIGLFKLASSR